MAERRALGVTLAQVGRELDVRPDQLRAWAYRQGREIGRTATVPGETVEQENRRLRREQAVLCQEQAFAKKWRCNSRKSRIEVHSPSGRVPGATHVPVLEVSPDSYYASLKRPPTWHALVDELLMALRSGSAFPYSVTG